MLPAVLLAGGLGTRVAALTGGRLPKAMLPVLGRPFIDYKLAQLAAGSVRDVLVLTGHGGDRLAAHLGDGTRFGMDIRCVSDPPQLLGTGGALRNSYEALPPSFWVTYADSFLPVDMHRIEEAHARANRPGTMTVLRNDDRWGDSNVAITGDRVTKYEKGAPKGTYVYIDYGLLILPRDVLLEWERGSAFDLAEVFGRLIEREEMTACKVDEPFHEIGSPEALLETESYLRTLAPPLRLPPMPPTEEP